MCTTLGDSENKLTAVRGRREEAETIAAAIKVPPIKRSSARRVLRLPRDEWPGSIGCLSAPAREATGPRSCSGGAA